MHVPALRRPARAVVATLTALGLVLTAAPASAALLPLPTRAAPLVPVSAELGKALSTLPKATPATAFVHVRGGTAASRAALVVDHGLAVQKDFPSIGVVYAAGTLGEIATLRRSAQVSYLSTDRKLTLLDDTSGWAMRVEQVQRSIGNGPYRDASGRVLDGSGIGVRSSTAASTARTPTS